MKVSKTVLSNICTIRKSNKHHLLMDHGIIKV